LAGKYWRGYDELAELWLRRTLGLKEFSGTHVLPLDKYKIAFVPIPKAGNSSIRRALMPLLEECGLPEQGSIHERTRAIAEPSSKFFDRVTPEWFVFTVVRNPAVRSQSAWQDKLIDREEIFHPLRSMGIRTRLDFPAFLKGLRHWPAWALNDHFKSQTLLLEHALGYDGLEVFKLEEIDQAWPRIRQEVQDRAGIDIGEMGWANKSSRKAAAFSDQERKLLNRLYGQDFTTFGYAFPKD
jgi:hypothetical protein